MATPKRVWIVGRSGRLGSALEGILNQDRLIKLFTTDLDDVDVTNLDDVVQFAERNRPDIIVNVAAKSDRAWCQSHPQESFALHSLGGRNLAIAADQIGAHLFYLSSDFVFDGLSHMPYTEFDHVNPQTVYGQTKVAGENMVRNHCSRHTILRSSWLYGKRTLSAFLRQAKDEGKVTISKTMYGSPTSSLDLAEAVIRMFDTLEYGTFHMSCEGECSQETFVQTLLRIFDLNVPVEEAAIPNDFEYLRPPYAVLDNYMLRMTGQPPLSEWEEGLRRFVKERHVGRGIV